LLTEQERSDIFKKLHEHKVEHAHKCKCGTDIVDEFTKFNKKKGRSTSRSRS